MARWGPHVDLRHAPRDERSSVWRWLTVAAALLLVGLASPTWTWAAIIAFPLVAGASAFHFFEPEVFQRWNGRGYTLLADALMVSLALLGTGSLPPALFLGFLGMVFVGLAASDRLRALLAGAILVGALYALGATGVLPGLAPSAATAAFLPLFAASAVHFGRLSELLPGHRKAVERAKRENQELRVLYEISHTIGKTLDVSDVLRSIVEHVGELVRTDSCSILLSDREQRHGFVVASRGHPDIDMLELDLRDYPEISRALETREPVYIEDVRTSSLIASVRETLIAKGYRTLLAIPLMFGDEVLGALFLRDQHEARFTPAEVRFCGIVAGASANALKNAILFRDMKREAAAHQATGEKLHRVLDCTPDLILTTDRRNRITQFNQGAEIATGRRSEDCVGQPLTAVFGDAVEMPDPDEDSRDPQDMTLPHAEGAKIEMNLVSAPLAGPEGERVGRVWVGRDVTKLRRVEKSLAQAERLSSLGEVVAGVAHELNNPLTGVIGYAELLRLKAHESGELRDLDRIVESAVRCQKIVMKLLSFARKHPPEMKYQSLNDCVTKVLDLKSYHLRTSRITTSLELDPGLPATCFDFHQLEQVVLNLLNNAEQAISTLRRPGTIVIRSGMTDDEVFFEVEDNGPGVPAAVRDRVFDPFFTTKPIGMGTGLGLSVSYGIVREHGGRIELTSVGEDGGACFTVRLPRAARPTAETEEPDLQEEIAAVRTLGGLRVLVAEDDPLVLELLQTMLAAEGADVTPTRDGQEAWDQIGENQYDVIVADLRMPNLDGQQLYEKIAEDRPDLLRRIVFATGDLVRQETIAFLEGLPNRILAKPFEIETVRRVLSQAVARKSN